VSASWILSQIRKDYERNLNSKDVAIKQLATAMWIIDRLALRVGNEKDEDEADTVGCCSLRVEHLKFDEDTKTLTMDFLGKDSMRHFQVRREKKRGRREREKRDNETVCTEKRERRRREDREKRDNETVCVQGLYMYGVHNPRHAFLIVLVAPSPSSSSSSSSFYLFQSYYLNDHGKVGANVFNNLKKFCLKKQDSSEVFDQLTTSDLNSHLGTLMPGLSAKVRETTSVCACACARVCVCARACVCVYVMCAPPPFLPPPPPLPALLISLPPPTSSPSRPPPPHSLQFFRTYNASITLQEELPDGIAHLTIEEKVLAYNKANREVAILCNHQKTVSKAFEAGYESMQGKLEMMKSQLSMLQVHQTRLKKGKKVKELKTASAAAEDKEKRAEENHLFSKQPSLDAVRLKDEWRDE
jgi:hypothetical protein